MRFKFEKEEITRFIRTELKTIKKFKEPFNFVSKQLFNLDNGIQITDLDNIDLSPLKPKEGKNYDWCTIRYKNVTLILRIYGRHITVFTKVVDFETVNEHTFNKTKYGAFTFHSNLDNLSDDEHDAVLDCFYDDPFYDFKKSLKDLFNLLIDRGVYWVTNSACIKFPKGVKIKEAFEENSIQSLDAFVFCMEELDHIYNTIFSEVIVVKQLGLMKTKIGEKLPDCYMERDMILKEIKVDVKDEYYHNTGIRVLKKDEEKWIDVYSINRWYFESVFDINLHLFKGELYVEGGQFEVGKPVAYKSKEINKVTLYKESFPDENFIPLQKY